MALQMEVTAEGLAKFRSAMETGTLVTLASAELYSDYSGGAVSGSKVATMAVRTNKSLDPNSNVFRFSCQDNVVGAYTAKSGKVLDADGVVVAIFHNNGAAVATKEEKAEILIGCEIHFEESVKVSDVVNMGDTSFYFNPDDATTEVKGVVELATEAEAKAGTDVKRAITPKVLDAVIKSHAEVVHRSGTETITGNKTFTGNLVLSNASPFVHVSQIDIVKGEQPASSQYMGIAFVDSTGQATENRLGVIETKYLADGSVCLSICAYKPEGGSTASVSLDLVYPVNGTPYITVPTPAFGDASTKIATTAWVKAVADKLLPLVGGVLTGALTISKGDLTLTEGIIKKGVKTDGLDICSGTSYEDSPALSLYPVDYAFDEAMRGRFVLRAGENAVQLVGTADGKLQWGGSNIVRSVDGFTAGADGNIALNAVRAPYWERAINKGSFGTLWWKDANEDPSVSGWGDPILPGWAIVFINNFSGYRSIYLNNVCVASYAGTTRATLMVPMQWKDTLVISSNDAYNNNNITPVNAEIFVVPMKPSTGF